MTESGFRWGILSLFVVFAGVVAPTPATATAAGPAAYHVVDLGTLPGDYSSVAMGINEHGQVVGWSNGPTGTRAFLYTDGAGMQPLPGPAGRPVTTARGVSSTGIVVGTAATGGTDIGTAVVWKGDTATEVGTIGSGSFSEARGVNDDGVVVGTSYTNGGSLLGVHAFRYDAVGGLVDLTPGYDNAHAEGVNDAGQVVGWRNSRAFRLTGSTFLDLGVPTGFAYSFGVAVNRSGQVAGHVVSPTGDRERIFRYTDGAGMELIGGTGQHNRAFGINGTGDVVGVGRPVNGPEQGFVYTDVGGMQALNALVDPAAGWFVLGAGAIDDDGVIAGWAVDAAGHHRAVVLAPGAGTPPAAPSELTAAAARGRVRLAWTDNAADESGFRVERATGTGPFVLLATLGPDRTSYVDRTVTRNTLYSYRVQAFSGGGGSTWSNIVTRRAR